MCEMPIPPPEGVMSPPSRLLYTDVPAQATLITIKYIFAIFYPFSQFCEIDVSLPSL